MSSHETVRHGRRKRKRTRKLSDNKDLMTSVVVMVLCGLILIGFLVYVLSTRACQLPRFLQ